MPELPEVERYRSVAIQAGVGHRISEVVVKDDPIVLDGCDAADVRRSLIGRLLRAVERKGKYLWWVLDRPPCVVFHFGMTGRMLSTVHAPLALKTAASTERGGWPPDRATLRVQFKTGAEVAFVTTRRMGRVRLVEAPLVEAPVNRLGADVLSELPELGSFQALFMSRRGNIKGGLLDQTRLAGLGNWMADEVLFMAKISPLRSSASLSDAEWEALRDAIVSVVEIAVAVEADSERFPSGWLFHQRWDAARTPQTLRGGLSFTTVGGRPTVFDPRRQR